MPGYFEAVVTPYYRAIATWHQTMRIGVTGGEVFGAIDEAFGASPLRPALNPGHLISYDEWVHSPIRAGSTEKVRSGMVFQCDIIPTPLPPGQLTNCEDTVAVADEGLRAELRANYPALWARVEARRQVMVEALGIRPGGGAAAADGCDGVSAAVLAGAGVGVYGERVKSLGERDEGRLPGRGGSSRKGEAGVPACGPIPGDLRPGCVVGRL